MLKVSTFCSGIGSPEVAIKNLGIEHEIIFAAEINKYARETYLANHSTKKMINDMTIPYYEGDEWYSDINISGLPCQAFSLAGKRLGELDARGLLFYDFYRYVKNQQPKYFIIENVKGLLSMDKGNVFNNWKALLGQSENGTAFLHTHEDSLMYNLHWKVLNTKNYGLPQNRERVFLIGIRKDLPNDFVFPKEIPLELRLKDLLEENVDEKYYLSEKTTEYVKKRIGVYTDINPNIARTLCAQYSQSINGSFVKEECKYGFYTCKNLGILCNSCESLENYEIVEDSELEELLEFQNDIIRKLTVLECFRLQGFPDSFVDKNNFIKSINNHGILVYICNEFKNKLLCNAKLKNAIEKQREGDIVSCTIKDSESMGTQISFLNTPIEEIKNAKYQVAIELFTQKDFVYHTTTPIENMETLYTLKKEGKMLSTELSHLVEKEELEKMGNQNTDLLLRIILDESWKKEKSYIISTLIHTIMKSVTCMCINQNQNTLRYIVSYEELPKKQNQPTKNSFAMESFILKTANTSYVSSSQLYKQAGNSISVPVIENILKVLLKKYIN